MARLSILLLMCVMVVGCGTFEPKPGMTVKELNSMSALSFSGNIVRADRLDNIGVDIYETSNQNRRRVRNAKPPEGGWTFVYVRGGRVIPEQEVRNLTAEAGKSAQLKSRTTPRPVTSRSVSSTTPQNANIAFRKCQPISTRILDRSGNFKSEMDTSYAHAFMVRLQGGKLFASYPVNLTTSSVSYNGAQFRSQRSATIDGVNYDVWAYDKESTFAGNRNRESIDFYFSKSHNSVLMMSERITENAPNILVSLHRCSN